MSSDSIYLTINETAALLKVSTKTLQRWRVSGGGPRFVDYGCRFIRYRREEVERWMREQEKSDGPEEV